MCKLTAFVTNWSACFVNWSWVAMFGQRFAFVRYPWRRRRGGISAWCWATLDDARRVLPLIAVVAGVTQSWTPILVTENPVDSIDGAYCGPDARLVGCV